MENSSSAGGLQSLKPPPQTITQKAVSQRNNHNNFKRIATLCDKANDSSFEQAAGRVFTGFRRSADHNIDDTNSNFNSYITGKNKQTRLAKLDL